MKLWMKWMLTALLAVGLVSLAAGCGGGDDDDSSSDTAAAGSTGTGSTGSGSTGTGDAADTADAADAPAEVVEVTHVNIAGVWSGTRSSSGGSTSMQFSFNQSGGDLQGSYQDTSGNSGNFTGSINGDDIQLSITMSGSGDLWGFTGAANATGTSMNGTMTTPGGSSTVQVSK